MKEVREEEIRFMKHAIKHKGKRIPVHYSKGSYNKESGLPEGTVTIYAKEYGHQLPRELNAENDTDMMTDYFEKDRARVRPGTKFHNQLKKLGYI